MQLLYRVYWAVTWLIYATRIKKIGKNAKFRLGGGIKSKGDICIGDGFFIGKDFLLATYPVNGKYGSLKIGNNVCAQERVRISAGESIVIGDNVLMASDILIIDNNHGMNAGIEKNYASQTIQTKPIEIGDGVWIGEKCTILPGSVIGEKAIIGANSVVTGLIPAYTIAVGAPARPIKKWDFELKQWKKI